MNSHPLKNISPLDGRYYNASENLRLLFSEYGLIKHRLLVEIEWLIWLSQYPQTPIQPLNTEQCRKLRNVVEMFSIEDAEKIKELEKTTKHDVKALEYWLLERLAALGMKEYSGQVHFGCTSEDINNLAWALILKNGRTVLFKQLQAILKNLEEQAQTGADLPMMARTHGMPASPTTYGKEMAIFVARLHRQSSAFMNVEVRGKFNGATGNHNAMCIAYPDISWRKEMDSFVTSLGLTYNAHTTQIETYDGLAELFHLIMRINSILLDLCRDIWGYVSLGYFEQTLKKGEVGSSTMPHKVNPINFENAEGNFGVANALAGHCADKLVVSRWQRDLSDSTVLRNLGVIFGHSLIGYSSLLKGLNAIHIRPETLREELEDAWELLTEAVQTLMRRAGINNAYGRIKDLTRGKKMKQDDYIRLVKGSGLSSEDQEILLNLKPSDYIGIAPELARTALKK